MAVTTTSPHFVYSTVTLDHTNSLISFAANKSILPKVPQVPKEVTYVIFVFNGLLSLIGLMGNMFVCFIIIRARKMYTIANLFLMNLAIADICILALSYPLWVIQRLDGDKWPFGPALCKIVPSVSDAFYGVSLGCMTTISIHRYRMIIHAMGNQLTFLHAKLIIIVIWLISLSSISVPLYPVLKYFEKDTGQRYCIPKWPSKIYEESYQMFLFTGWYIVPLFIILYTFLRIRYYLRKQLKYEWLKGAEHNVLISNHILGINKALRMLAPVVILFAILMVPWNILRIVSLFYRLHTIQYHEIYVLIAGTMLVGNSVINPFIYYIMSVEFRIEFQKQFWLLKLKLGIVKDSNEFTIQADRNGRKFVRRFESIAYSEYPNRMQDSAAYNGHTNSRKESYYSISNSLRNCKYSSATVISDCDEILRNYEMEKNELGKNGGLFTITEGSNENILKENQRLLRPLADKLDDNDNHIDRIGYEKIESYKLDLNFWDNFDVAGDKLLKETIL